MLAKPKILIASSLLTILLFVGLSDSALAETTSFHNPQIVEQLSDFKQTASEMRREAETLKSMTPNKRLSWESHTYRLATLKDQVNEMGRALAELEAQKSLATEEQSLAIEHARPHLVSVAQNLTQAIELVNENRNSIQWGEYGDSVSDIYAHADALHTKLDTILDYEKVRLRFDRLEVEPSPTGGY
jgi:hypothetical protein